jgi:hypothetical protein
MDAVTQDAGPRNDPAHGDAPGSPGAGGPGEARLKELASCPELPAAGRRPVLRGDDDAPRVLTGSGRRRQSGWPSSPR